LVSHSEKQLHNQSSSFGRFQDYLREFVYGGIDGSITTFAVVAGAEGANLSSSIVIIMGFANLIADGFAMSVGSYLSSKSEREIYNKHKGLNWIIDPLDGTTNFIHGIPVYSISIALIDHLELKFGMVYEINRDEIFYAIQNGGAYMNEEKIFVSEENSLNKSLIDTSFQEIWQNETYNSFRSSLLKSREEIDICKNCTEGTKVWA